MADKPQEKGWAGLKGDLKWGIMLLFIAFLVISTYFLDPWKKEPAGEEVLADMTTEIFAQDGLVVPFEVLSILLLAALIAGVVIALREPEGGA